MNSIFEQYSDFILDLKESSKNILQLKPHIKKSYSSWFWRRAHQYRFFDNSNVSNVITFNMAILSNKVIYFAMEFFIKKIVD